jgi:hypothetical protein
VLGEPLGQLGRVVVHGNVQTPAVGQYAVHPHLGW